MQRARMVAANISQKKNKLFSVYTFWKYMVWAVKRQTNERRFIPWLNVSMVCIHYACGNKAYGK
jgi:hypothetical protein